MLSDVPVVDRVDLRSEAMISDLDGGRDCGWCDCYVVDSVDVCDGVNTARAANA